MIKKNISKIFFSFIIVLTLISFTNAGGCCFNPLNGKCSLNAEEYSCNGGEFFSSPSCSVSKCDLACCILGSDAQYITSRECQILSNSAGFSYPGNWQGMDESSCMALKNNQEKGACLSGSDYPKECKYKTSGECGSGEFHPGVFCTDSGLNTVCKKTTKTMCFEENVYGKDSCGNPDGLVSTCNYEEGFLCEQKDKNLAECKDLNCNEAEKKNGESWCAGEAETGAVGSRAFVQTCINGKVETEPCADFRMEMCVPSEEDGEAKCEINPWQECSAANSEEADPVTGSMVKEDECSEEFCKIWPEGLECNVMSSYTGGNLLAGDCSGEKELVPPAGSTVAGWPAPSISAMKSVLFQDLHLEKCVSIMPGGLQTYASSERYSQASSESTAASVCSEADYSATLYFDHDGSCGHWRLKSWENPNEYINPDEGIYGFAGIIDLLGYDYQFDPRYPTLTYLNGDWKPDNCESNGLLPIASNPIKDIVGYGSNQATKVAKAMNELAGSGTLPDPMLIRVLEERCRMMGDCDGKANWVEGVGGSGGESIFHCKNAGGSGDHVTCTFDYKCSPWEAPGEGECELCNEENSGLPCSEYRCKSISSNCDYHEPEGIDEGYCMSSDDTSAPEIISIDFNPDSPVPPYTPVEITLVTDENSKCKFNIKNAGAKFEDMTYDFGQSYSTEHKITLTLPGQTGGLDEETKSYDLINKEGKYTLYVRCIDPAGNGKSKPAYPLNFEVMTYPDKGAPSLSNFKPISGSRIKFNTTEKTIYFELNEPSQCKWDLAETYDMDKMRYNFTCDETINSNALDKYKCTGKLTNVTTAFENETTFYIRCKDQPWITEGSIIENGVNYSRNEMKNAYVYKLRASEKFYISELSPNGLVEASSDNLNITLTAMTMGGAFYGRANCSWRSANTSEKLAFETFHPFKITDSSTSKQIISSPNLGENYFEVKCNDNAGNEDSSKTTINLVIDDASPFINRLYKFSSKLKLKTDEDSLCYYSFDRITNCLFDINNASLMSGLYSSEHEIDWTDDKTYYVKCKDIFGNYDSGCGKIIRTY